MNVPISIRPSTVMTKYADAIRAHRLAVIWTWASGLITGLVIGLYA